MHKQLSTLIISLLFASCGGSSQDALSYRVACMSESACAHGSSCLDGICVEHGTRTLSYACTNDLQCAEGLHCANGTCEPGCGKPYSVRGCPQGNWCTLTESRTDTACVPSSCDESNTPCSQELQCVSLADNTGTCVHYCDIIFMGDQAHDPCPEVLPNTACGILKNHSRLMCLAQSSTARPLMRDEPGCSTSVPCENGLVCVDNICRKWCDPNKQTTCPSTHTCVNDWGGHNLNICLPR